MTQLTDFIKVESLPSDAALYQPETIFVLPDGQMFRVLWGGKGIKRITARDGRLLKSEEKIGAIVSAYILKETE